LSEIRGTFDWSVAQIRAYAGAFREGDAVMSDGKFSQVLKRKSDGIHYAIDGLNPFLINYHREGELAVGISHGFLKSHVKTPYEIVTPKDYEVQEGDKLVRLGKTIEYYGCSEFTFGETYEVFRSEDGYLFYKNDMTTALLASYLKEEGDMWGVIPKWENVKERTHKDFKFSVGDTVRLVDDDSLSGYEKRFIGEVGEVVIVDDVYPYAVKFGDYQSWFEENALELVEETELIEEEEDMCKEFKFSVGDVVRGVDNGSLDKLDKDYVGVKGVVKIVDGMSESLPYAIEFETRSHLVWFAESALEIVDEEEVMHGKEESFNTINHNGKFELGDRVKVKNAVFISNEHYVGKTGVISHISDFETNAPYHVTFGLIGYDCFCEEELELIESVSYEKSPSTEQQAYDLLVDFYGEGKVRQMLRDKVKGVVNTCVNSNDFKGAMKAVKIAEQLEGNAE